MKAVSDNFAGQFSSFGGSPEDALDTALLGRIGDDLRHLYGAVTDAEMPRGLLDLAETIDAHRTGDGPRD